MLRGRKMVLKASSFNYSSYVHPSMDTDCQVSDKAPSVEDSIQQQYNYSQIYLYKFTPKGRLTNQLPSNCLPWAIMSFSCQTTVKQLIFSPEKVKQPLKKKYGEEILCSKKESAGSVPAGKAVSAKKAGGKGASGKPKKTDSTDCKTQNPKRNLSKEVEAKQYIEGKMLTLSERWAQTKRSKFQTIADNWTKKRSFESGSSGTLSPRFDEGESNNQGKNITDKGKIGAGISSTDKFVDSLGAVLSAKQKVMETWAGCKPSNNLITPEKTVQKKTCEIESSVNSLVAESKPATEGEKIKCVTGIRCTRPDTVTTNINSDSLGTTASDKQEIIGKCFQTESNNSQKVPEARTKNNYEQDPCNEIYSNFDYCGGFIPPEDNVSDNRGYFEASLNIVCSDVFASIGGNSNQGVMTVDDQRFNRSYLPVHEYKSEIHASGEIMDTQPRTSFKLKKLEDEILENQKRLKQVRALRFNKGLHALESTHESTSNVSQNLIQKPYVTSGFNNPVQKGFPSEVYMNTEKFVSNDHRQLNRQPYYESMRKDGGFETNSGQAGNSFDENRNDLVSVKSCNRTDAKRKPSTLKREDFGIAAEVNKKHVKMTASNINTFDNQSYPSYQSNPNLAVNKHLAAIAACNKVSEWLSMSSSVETDCIQPLHQEHSQPNPFVEGTIDTSEDMKLRDMDLASDHSSDNVLSESSKALTIKNLQSQLPLASSSRMAQAIRDAIDLLSSMSKPKKAEEPTGQVPMHHSRDPRLFGQSKRGPALKESPVSKPKPTLCGRNLSESQEIPQVIPLDYVGNEALIDPRIEFYEKQKRFIIGVKRKAKRGNNGKPLKIPSKCASPSCEGLNKQAPSNTQKQQEKLPSKNHISQEVENVHFGPGDVKGGFNCPDNALKHDINAKATKTTRLGYWPEEKKYADNNVPGLNKVRKTRWSPADNNTCSSISKIKQKSTIMAYQQDNANFQASAGNHGNQIDNVGIYDNQKTNVELHEWNNTIVQKEVVSNQSSTGTPRRKALIQEYQKIEQQINDLEASKGKLQVRDSQDSEKIPKGCNTAKELETIELKLVMLQNVRQAMKTTIQSGWHSENESVGHGNPNTGEWQQRQPLLPLPKSTARPAESMQMMSDQNTFHGSLVPISSSTAHFRSEGKQMVLGQNTSQTSLLPLPRSTEYGGQADSMQMGPGQNTFQTSLLPLPRSTEYRRQEDSMQMLSGQNVVTEMKMMQHSLFGGAPCHSSWNVNGKIDLNRGAVDQRKDIGPQETILTSQFAQTSNTVSKIKSVIGNAGSEGNASLFNITEAYGSVGGDSSLDSNDYTQSGAPKEPGTPCKDEITWHDEANAIVHKNEQENEQSSWGSDYNDGKRKYSEIENAEMIYQHDNHQSKRYKNDSSTSCMNLNLYSKEHQSSVQEQTSDDRRMFVGPTCVDNYSPHQVRRSLLEEYGHDSIRSNRRVHQSTSMSMLSTHPGQSHSYNISSLQPKRGVFQSSLNSLASTYCKQGVPSSSERPSISPLNKSDGYSHRSNYVGNNWNISTHVTKPDTAKGDVNRILPVIGNIRTLHKGKDEPRQGSFQVHGSDMGKGQFSGYQKDSVYDARWRDGQVDWGQDQRQERQRSDSQQFDYKMNDGYSRQW
uniref:Uncharacterized protein LOC102805077 n=1 Tax=Saccoglossus kowalevskii TaxID=10224 RepID=A0ABM0N1I4_SACKO